MLVNENTPLCVSLAKHELRKARMFLEDMGFLDCIDGEILNGLRNKLEMCFDLYLDQKTTKSRQQFTSVVDEIEQLRMPV